MKFWIFIFFLEIILFDGGGDYGSISEDGSFSFELFFCFEEGCVMIY